MSLSYHPLHLVDVLIYTIVVHRGLALPVQPVLLRHGSKLIGCLVATEPIPGLWILNQPIAPLKVLLLGRIDPVDLGGLYLPLQHLRAKKKYICMSK
jgi:hypothetical protein